MDREHVVRALRVSIEQAGSIAAWSRKHGIAEGYPRHVLDGSHPPGPKILTALGLRRVERYEVANG